MNIELTTLPNGVRVVTDHMPHLETATIGVWADVGARHETAAINGIAHMLEHMAFKGTQRRSARAIAEEIEAVGGYLNAYTSREHTVYYARVLKDDVALATDLLSDILLNSVFDAEELERERHVILQEIGQAHDTPDDLVFDLLQDATYPDHPMGRPILGTADTVAAMRRDDLQDYLNTHYRGDRLVVVGAGQVSHQALVSQVAETLGTTPGAAPGAVQPARYGGGERRDHRPLEQVHLALGFPGVAFSDTDYFAAQVYTTVLGGGMSSRLFQEVREVRGLAYAVYSYAQSYMDGGGIGIYAGTGEADVTELVPVIADEMRALMDTVSEEEVARARAQLKAGLLMSLESSSSRMEQIGRQLLVHGRVVPTAELIAAIEAVDQKAVCRVAARTLRDGPLTLAAVGPLDQLEAYENIRRRFAA